MQDWAINKIHELRAAWVICYQLRKKKNSESVDRKIFEFYKNQIIELFQKRKQKFVYKWMDWNQTIKNSTRWFNKVERQIPLTLGDLHHPRKIKERVELFSHALGERCFCGLSLSKQSAEFARKQAKSRKSRDMKKNLMKHLVWFCFNREVFCQSKISDFCLLMLFVSANTSGTTWITLKKTALFDRIKSMHTKTNTHLLICSPKEK